MTGVDGGPSAGRPGSGAPPGEGRVSFLEQALWKRFSESESAIDFAAPWLALQCRFIPGATRGVVVLGGGDGRPMVPVAFFPEETQELGGLAAAAELAIAEKSGVVHKGEGESQGSRYLAYPFMLDSVARGVVAIELRQTLGDDLRDAMRQLQWGTGWILAMLRREQHRDDEVLRERSAAVLDLAATVLEHGRFRAASNAAASDLARRLECDQVSIGFRRRGRTVVAALSYAAQFGRRMNLVRDLGNAMDEAIDQGAVVAYPPIEGQDYRADRAHAELARRHETGHLLTVPFHDKDSFFGAITFERAANHPFDAGTIEVCDSVAEMVGPILREKRHNDRWIVTKIIESLWRQTVRLIGPRYPGRKLVVLALGALVAFFATATGEYRVSANARLEGAVLRAITAPFDGYIASQGARAGQIVSEGEILASLDDEELAIERLKWETRRLQHLTEYDRALAERERSEALIVQAQIEQAQAQVALLDAQLARIDLRAPFDGIVVTGDLSQSVGAAVKRGDQLFEIAPLSSYRVVLEVAEGDVRNISTGQGGQILLASLPDEPYPFEVRSVIPTVEAKEGLNFYRVEAELTEVSPRLRPGMEGVAKVDVEERLLISIWSAHLVDWLTLFAWRWLP